MTLKKFLALLVGLTVLIGLGMRVTRHVTTSVDGADGKRGVADLGVHQEATPTNATAPTGTQGTPAPAVPIEPVPEHLAPNQRRTKWGLVTMPTTPDHTPHE
jgi:hypothetical protein